MCNRHISHVPRDKFTTATWKILNNIINNIIIISGCHGIYSELRRRGVGHLIAKRGARGYWRVSCRAQGRVRAVIELERCSSITLKSTAILFVDLSVPRNPLGPQSAAGRKQIGVTEENLISQNLRYNNLDLIPANLQWKENSYNQTFSTQYKLIKAPSIKI